MLGLLASHLFCCIDWVYAAKAKSAHVSSCTVCVSLCIQLCTEQSVVVERYPVFQVCKISNPGKSPEAY